MSTILIGYRRRYRLRQNHPHPHLKEHFGPEVTVIGHDNYYKRQDGKTLEERAKVNYDHPAAFDTELLIEHLKELKEGRPHPLPGLLLCGAQPHGGDPGDPPHQGHHRRGHPDFPEPHSPGYV